MLDAASREQLVNAARIARQRAYAPYSHDFKVGAAVLTSSGHIFSGCNIENASLGATVCAERVAIFSAVAAGEREIVAIAVIADTRAEPVRPCGICRQVLSEFGQEATVLMASTDGLLEIASLSDLLPHHFNFIRSQSAE